MSHGVINVTKLFTQGLIGTKKGSLANIKYANVPISIAIGRIQFLMNFSIIISLTLKHHSNRIDLAGWI